MLVKSSNESFKITTSLYEGRIMSDLYSSIFLCCVMKGLKELCSMSKGSHIFLFLMIFNQKGRDLQNIPYKKKI